MSRDEIIDSINTTIDQAIEKINSQMSAVETRVLNEVRQIARDLDYDGDKIKQTAKNLRVIGNITRKLRRIILDSGYKNSVSEYMKSFSAVTSLQNTYMRMTVSDFKVSPVLNVLKEQAITQTINALTEQGLTAGPISQIQSLLRKNITSGGSYKDMVKDLNITIKGADQPGALVTYIRGAAQDSLHMYSREYLQLSSAGTPIVWYQYTGSNIKTTRCFCHAMTEKRYFHQVEIPDILEGDFEEFKKMSCEIYKRTKLPDGMFPDTNADNFLTNLGGYNCGHRAVPIPARLVPEDVKNVVYAKYPSARKAAIS